MTHRLATNYAKNYCNRTLIVKVIAENVVTCFFGDTVLCRAPFHRDAVVKYFSRLHSVSCLSCFFSSACPAHGAGELIKNLG